MVQNMEGDTSALSVQAVLSHGCECCKVCQQGVAKTHQNRLRVSDLPRGLYCYELNLFPHQIFNLR